MHPEIESVSARIRRQSEEIATLVRGLDDAEFSRRPAEDRWAVGEHLAHLGNTIPPYTDAMRRAVENARRKGWTHDGGPYRGTRMGRWFQSMLEPPPKRRVKTFGAMKPPPVEEVARAPTLAEFEACQRDLLEVLASGDGLDLGRARIGSPFVPWLFFVRFAVIQSARHMAAHTDRHLWLMREALGQMGIDAPGVGEGGP